MKHNLTCTFIKFFISHIVMAIIMYALHENTCVYEVQKESFYWDLENMLNFNSLFLQMACIHI
jgi:hypothetical protein